MWNPAWNDQQRRQYQEENHCWKCGLIGHWGNTPQCPQPRPNSQGIPRRVNMVNQQAVEVEEVNENISVIAQYWSTQLSSAKGFTLFQVQINISIIQGQV